MTPLAHRIAKEMTGPRKLRTFKDPSCVTQKLPNCHFFECTEVVEAATSLVWDESADLTKNVNKIASVAETTNFLPAPFTWLEYIWDGRRGAVLLADTFDGWADAFFLDGPTFMSAPVRGRYPLRGAAEKKLIAVEPVGDLAGIALKEWGNMVSSCFPQITGLLAMINTPRIIGRDHHHCHFGLGRKLKRIFGEKFPLSGWTEIKLSVTPPDLQVSESNTESFRGAKALHFCRSHLRVRLGKVELVSAHWRGDPALGIRQSKYTVKH